MKTDEMREDDRGVVDVEGVVDTGGRLAGCGRPYEQVKLRLVQLEQGTLRSHRTLLARHGRHVLHSRGRRRMAYVGILWSPWGLGW